jgi:predicted solute-binding protein
MDIIQQIAVKAVEEFFESVKVSGLSDIGKTIKALTPVVSRTVLSILTTFLEEMDEALVTGAKALRKEDGITVKERDVPRTWLTELVRVSKFDSAA